MNIFSEYYNNLWQSMDTLSTVKTRFDEIEYDMYTLSMLIVDYYALLNDVEYSILFNLPLEYDKFWEEERKFLKKVHTLENDIRHHACICESKFHSCKTGELSLEKILSDGINVLKEKKLKFQKPKPNPKENKSHD